VIRETMAFTLEIEHFFLKDVSFENSFQSWNRKVLGPATLGWKRAGMEPLTNRG
jgi:hypothetical protein